MYLSQQLSKRKFSVMKVFCVIICAGLISMQNYAQTSIPTLAPTKTPTSEAGESNQAVEANVAESAILSRSFTQEDLSVLVGEVQKPNGIEWFDDNLYAVCNGDSTLYEINSVSGQTRTFIFGIRDAHDLHAEETEDGYNLWIPDFDTNTLYLLDQDRTLPNPISAELNGPWGIDQLDEERFIITNLRSGEIVTVTRDGELNIVAEGLRSPTGIVIHDDRLFVANNGSARLGIQWADIDGLLNEDSEMLEFETLVSGLQNVSNLVMGQDGYLYFTYALGTRGVVGRIDPNSCLDGACTNNETEIVLYTELQAPLAGLTLSDDMRLFVHSIYQPEIYWVSLYDQD